MSHTLTDVVRRVDALGHTTTEEVTPSQGALDLIDCALVAAADEDGVTLTVDVFRALTDLQGQPDSRTTQWPCFFCKVPGHRWMRCTKLKAILKANGMKDYVPRPRPTTDDVPTAKSEN